MIVDKLINRISHLPLNRFSPLRVECIGIQWKGIDIANRMKCGNKVHAVEKYRRNSFRFIWFIHSTVNGALAEPYDIVFTTTERAIVLHFFPVF